jgi:hypothetical protein
MGLFYRGDFGKKGEIPFRFQINIKDYGGEETIVALNMLNGTHIPIN